MELIIDIENNANRISKNLGITRNPKDNTVRGLSIDFRYSLFRSGKKINLEVQRADAGATSKRARYHSSSLDVEFLKTKDDFSMLPETYVIFITSYIDSN